MWKNKSYLKTYAAIFMFFGVTMLVLAFMPLMRANGFFGALISVVLPAAICFGAAYMGYQKAEEARKLINNGFDVDYNYGEIAVFSGVLVISFVIMMILLVAILVGGLMN